MKNILITGGAGFIGHHFIEHILKNTDWNIVVLDRLDTSGNVNRITDIDCWAEEKHRVKFYHTDLRAPLSDALLGMITKKGTETFDYIVHFAAGTHVDRSITDPMAFVYDNVVATGHLIDAVRQFTNVDEEHPEKEYYLFLKKGGKFLQFSTDEVFGPAPEGVLYKEWDRHNGNNPYAATKSGAEQLVNSFAHTFKLPVSIIHCMNVFGERQLSEKFIPMTIKKVLNGDMNIIHSDKSKTKAGTRFYLHARNICSAVLWVLENGKTLNGSGTQGVYNVVGDLEVSNLDMAHYIAKFVGEWQLARGLEVTPLKYEMVDFHSSRPGHDLRYGLDGGLIKSEGWIAPVDFEDSLRKTVFWTLDHKDKWL